MVAKYDNNIIINYVMKQDNQTEDKYVRCQP